MFTNMQISRGGKIQSLKGTQKVSVRLSKFLPIRMYLCQAFLPAAKRQVKCWRRSKKKRKKGHVSFFIAILASLPGIFSTGPIIWVSMDLPGPQQSYLRQFGPRGQILGPRALWPQISKLRLSLKILQHGFLWTCLEPCNHF